MPKVLSESDIDTFKKEICDVAAKQFAEQGFEKVTMRNIASELGCSRMKPYSYFKDKSALLAGVRTEGFRLFINNIEEIIDGQDDPIEKMRQFSESYFSFAVEKNDLYSLMFSTKQGGHDQYPELDYELLRLQETFAKASKVCAHAGIINKDERLASQLFWAGMHGIVSLHLSDSLKLGYSFEELSQQMVETLFRGMVK